jgi:hypothetical protein
MSLQLEQKPPGIKQDIFSEFRLLITDAIKKIDHYNALPKSAYELEVLKK